MRIFPEGTALVREVRNNTDRGVSIGYVWGAVRNYVSPYWRVRYEDGEWEQMTRTQVKQAIQLAEAVRDQARKVKERSASRQSATVPPPAPVAQVPVAPEVPTVMEDDSRPHITLQRLPALPADFGAPFVGDMVWYHFSTGWARGVLQEYYPSRMQYTFDVLFDGEQSPRRMRLRPGDYRTPKDSAFSSWNVLTARPA